MWTSCIYPGRYRCHSPLGSDPQTVLGLGEYTGLSWYLPSFFPALPRATILECTTSCTIYYHIKTFCMKLSIHIFWGICMTNGLQGLTHSWGKSPPHPHFLRFRKSEVVFLVSFLSISFTSFLCMAWGTTLTFFPVCFTHSSEWPFLPSSCTLSKWLFYMNKSAPSVPS